MICTMCRFTKKQDNGTVSDLFPGGFGSAKIRVRVYAGLKSCSMCDWFQCVGEFYIMIIIAAQITHDVRNISCSAADVEERLLNECVYNKSWLQARQRQLGALNLSVLTKKKKKKNSPECQ